MSHTAPRGHRLARWLLLRCSLDGAPLYGDLLEAWDTRARRSGRLANDLWFAREVIVACWYGARDRLADGAVRRFLQGSGQPVRVIRALRRRPVYACTVVLLMGIAAGSVGGLAGIAGAIDVPRDAASRAVRVIVGTDSERGWRSAYLSYPEIKDLEERMGTLEEVGAFLADASLGLGRGPSARPVSVVFADARYFRILGARTHLGRTFTEAEGLGREGPLAILSWSLWREQYGSATDIVGRTIEVAERTYTILGVMAADFRPLGGSARPDLFLPLGDAPAYFGADVLTSRAYRWLLGVARVAPDGAAALGDGAERVAASLRREYPITHRGRGFAFLDLERWWFGRVESPVRILLGCAVGLLLLVLGNLTVLFRVRSQERAPEMALRAALGAGRQRLFVVVLSEALILALASAVVGLAAAAALMRWGGVPILLDLPHFAVPRVRVFVVLACAFAIVPLSLLFARSSPGGRVGVRRRPARGLLAAESALAALFLTGGGALLKDAREVARMPTGFEAPGLLTAQLDLTLAATDSAVIANAAAERIGFAEALVSAAPAVPGVASAALVGPSVLGDAHWHLPFVPEGRDPQANARRWLAQRIIATPGALATLGVAVLQGRDLAWSDRNPGAPVAVIDERIAQRFWPDGDAIGKRFCGSAVCMTPLTIVGVAEAAKHRGRAVPDGGVVGDVYLSYLASPPTRATLAIRTDGTAGDVARDMRTLADSLSGAALISDVQWMDDRLRSGELLQRMTASLVAAYAAVAALLALIGIYGLVVFQLGRHWRDIAVRIALGARTTVLGRAVLAEAVVPVVVGAIVGAAGGLVCVPALTGAVSRVGGIGGWGWTDSAIAMAYLLAAAVGSGVLPLFRLRFLRPMAVLRAD